MKTDVANDNGLPDQLELPFVEQTPAQQRLINEILSEGEDSSMELPNGAAASARAYAAIEALEAALNESVSVRAALVAIPGRGQR